MNKIISVLLFGFCLFCQNTSAQSLEYTIESFQDQYVELENYHSLALLTKGDLLWEYEFDLEFPFPFFDSSYNRVIFDYHSWGSFTDFQDDALQLLEFSYLYDNVLDPKNIDSDLRFTHTEINNKKAFVMQWTKVHIFADPSYEEHGTYLNFQSVLYEDGTIDIRFGDINLDSSDIYVPGEGFYSGDILFGPWVSIAHPILEGENAIGLEGAYNDFEIVRKNNAVLSVLPPEGWVIRFKPLVTSAVNIAESEEIKLSPNPVNDILHLPINEGTIAIHDLSGQKVHDMENLNGRIDVQTLSSGMYVLHLKTKDKNYHGKFIRL